MFDRNFFLNFENMTKIDFKLYLNRETRVLHERSNKFTESKNQIKIIKFNN